MSSFSRHFSTAIKGVIARLLRDRAGNTLAMIAAALFPLLALVGGGIDMGRSYLSQARLQQACDAGVLAARKKLGAGTAASGTLPADAEAIGKRFFNLNFRNGSYGSRDRAFAMSVANDYSISGTATVDVPTTIMALFGYQEVPIEVECQARLNFSNTDVMFVLDTTGSMAWANPGDTQPKIDVLRSVVKSFHNQLEKSKSPGTRIRYGFLPYSTNVNVGYLLKSDWVVDKWDYHGRISKETGKWETYDVFNTTYGYLSGSASAIATTTGTACPASTVAWLTVSYSQAADGSVHAVYEVTGDNYGCNTSSDGSMVTITGTHYDHFRFSYDYVKTGTASREIYKWKYEPVSEDVRFLKGANGDSPLKGGSLEVPMYGNPSPTPTNMTAWFRGCMEERSTYEIDDYSDVDLSRALDLDLDLVPDRSNPDTQWRPMLNEISWEPEIWWNGTGTFNTKSVVTSNDYLMAHWAGLSACPAQAQKLKEMDSTQVSTYVDSLFAQGSTYHDIGMIWGGRMLSPTGLFASENADIDGKPTNRHLIFLTDGETAPLDLSYGTYGIEPLDQRRWSQSSPETLTQVVEKRFGVACDEVKKRNITVWIIGFGTKLNPVMTQCAGAGHYFEAKDASELYDVFSRISAQLGDLRVTR